MSEKINMSSEKSFGIVFSVVFLLLGIYFFIYNIKSSFIFALISIFFLLISFIKPTLLKIPNFLWHKLSLALNKIFNPIIMFLIYSVSILPLGIILKIIGKKLTIKKIDHKINSYWIKRTNNDNSMRDQF